MSMQRFLFTFTITLTLIGAPAAIAQDYLFESGAVSGGHDWATSTGGPHEGFTLLSCECEDRTDAFPGPFEDVDDLRSGCVGALPTAMILDGTSADYCVAYNGLHGDGVVANAIWAELPPYWDVTRRTGSLADHSFVDCEEDEILASCSCYSTGSDCSGAYAEESVSRCHAMNRPGGAGVHAIARCVAADPEPVDYYHVNSAMRLNYAETYCPADYQMTGCTCVSWHDDVCDSAIVIERGGLQVCQANSRHVMDTTSVQATATCVKWVDEGCDGHIGGQSPDGCWCDAACESPWNEDCCADYFSQDRGCSGHCGGESPGGCWCDAYCEMWGDCCDDIADHCD